LVFAQGATCASDGEQPAQGAAIACVTGAGVQVQSATQGQGQGLGIVPLTPEQMPANPPLVTYVNGKLSIVAKNSTLRDILRVVGEKTGAVIDVPESADERVVSQLGPGPAREVIASLLNGSHFNYVMVGNETDASAVTHVVLTAKSDGKTPPAGAAPGSANTPTMAGAFRPYVQPRTALQRAVMQPYQELQEQQRAQEVNTPSFQPSAANEETPAPTEPEAAPQVGVPTASLPATNAPATIPAATPATAGTETASVDSNLPTNEGGGTPRGANASGERSAQQMLQDLYETRRQMMQQQRQGTPQQ
jgi:hypothetical protein